MLVCIDPGHAKNTAGKRSFDGSLLEYEFNRDVAKRLKYHLERHGVKTMYSCDIETATDISRTARCRTANNASAALFVSIHANAHGTTWNDANGWEIFHAKNSTKGKRLAEAIHKTCEPSKDKLLYLDLRDRGVKTGDYTVLTNTKMPAVIIEHGFYTNKEECAKLKDLVFREKCAIADTKGILDYFGILWKEEMEEAAKMDDISVIKNKIGLEDQTIEYLKAYKFGAELIRKIANAVK